MLKVRHFICRQLFRAQNPCLFNIDGTLFRKENAYVFDFDPARTLDIFEQFANDLSADTTSGKGDMDIAGMSLSPMTFPQ